MHGQQKHQNRHQKLHVERRKILFYFVSVVLMIAGCRYKCSVARNNQQEKYKLLNAGIFFKRWVGTAQSVQRLLTERTVKGIESWWSRDFLYPFKPELALTHPPVQSIPGLFPGGNRPERALHPPPSLAPRLKKE